MTPKTYLFLLLMLLIAILNRKKVIVKQYNRSWQLVTVFLCVHSSATFAIEHAHAHMPTQFLAAEDTEKNHAKDAKESLRNLL